MIKRKDYKYLNNPDYSLAGEQFLKNATDFLTSNSVVNAAYLSSNEQLDKYMPMLNLKGKKLATVGSSGDQILNALLYGSRDITFIDGNVLAQPYIEYKFALIKALSYEEFKYVLLDDKSAFEWKIYKKISPYLSGTVRQFFDEIMLMQDSVEFGTMEYYEAFNDFKIFNSIVNNLPHTEFSEFYHSKNAYEKIKKILLDGSFNLTFETSRLEDFSKVLKEKYDVILLSNIYDYVPRFKFNPALKSLYKNNLNSGGIIQFQYLFEESIFRKKRPKQMEGFDIEVVELPSQKTQDPELKDRDECKVYLLKKPNSKQLELG